MSSSGRKTDPRMDLAVVLCLRNPKIDRFDALLGGGFVYPRPEEAHVTEMRLKASEGVALRQRKNQLRRHLGLVEKKMKRKRPEDDAEGGTAGESCTSRHDSPSSDLT